MMELKDLICLKTCLDDKVSEGYISRICADEIYCYMYNNCYKDNNYGVRYKVKETFRYEPAYGRTDDDNLTTVFYKDDIYVFAPYTGISCKPGEMVLQTQVKPKSNNGWVWSADFFNEHFEKVK